MFVFASNVFLVMLDVWYTDEQKKCFLNLMFEIYLKEKQNFLSLIKEILLYVLIIYTFIIPYFFSLITISIYKHLYV